MSHAMPYPRSARRKQNSWSTISSSCCVATSATNARRHARARAPARRPELRRRTLVDGILAGTDLHANTRDLAAKAVRAGMNGGAIVNLLRGLMDSSAAPHDKRWQDRYDNLPRQVASIEAKIAAEAAAAAAGAAPPPPPAPPPGVG